MNKAAFPQPVSSQPQPKPQPPDPPRKWPPWCRQTKAALRLIREGFDAEHAVSSALSVYLALTELASDKESTTFTATHCYLGQLSGCSVASVKRRLAGLVELGLVHVQTSRLREPSVYTLLQRPDSPPDSSLRANGKTPAKADSSLRANGKPQQKPLAHGELAIAHGAFTGCELHLKNREEPERIEKGGSDQRRKIDPPAFAAPLVRVNGEDAPPLERMETRFPRSDEEAELAATVAACPVEFALSLYHDAYGRGGLDARRKPIRNWPAYLKTCWEREHEKQAGKPLSILDAKDKIKVLDKWRGELKRKHANEGESGASWTDKAKLEEYRTYGRQIRDLEKTILQHP